MSLELKTIKYNSKFRNGLFTLISTLVFIFLFIGFIGSLFTYNASMKAINDTNLLIMPTNLDIKPKEEIQVKQNRTKRNQNQNERNVRKENILNIIETPRDIPPVSVEKSIVKQRPVEIPFDLGTKDIVRNVTSLNEEVPTGESIGGQKEEGKNNNVVEKEPEIVKPTPKEIEKPKVRLPVSTILNSKAISLPKPNYPRTAIAVGAQGNVSVTVRINKQGFVVSAVATSGHPLLRYEAEKAAKNAKFSPTILGGEAIEVTGTIIYNFIR